MQILAANEPFGRLCHLFKLTQVSMPQDDYNRHLFFLFKLEPSLAPELGAPSSANNFCYFFAKIYWLVFLKPTIGSLMTFTAHNLEGMRRNGPHRPRPASQT